MWGFFKQLVEIISHKVLRILKSHVAKGRCAAKYGYILDRQFGHKKVHLQCLNKLLQYDKELDSDSLVSNIFG